MVLLVFLISLTGQVFRVVVEVSVLNSYDQPKIFLVFTFVRKS